MDVVAAEAALFEQRLHIRFVENAVRIGFAERPVLHCRTGRHVDGDASTGAKHPVGLPYVGAGMVEEIDHIGGEDRVETAIRPFERAEAGLHEFHSARNDRCLVAFARLAGHLGRPVDAANAPGTRSRGKLRQTEPRAEAQFQDILTRPGCQGFDRQFDGAAVRQCHQTAGNHSRSAARAGKLVADGRPEPLPESGARATRRLVHPCAWILPSNCWITSRRLWSHTGRSVFGAMVSAFCRTASAWETAFPNRGSRRRNIPRRGCRVPS